jgi:hypothetical protein
MTPEQIQANRNTAAAYVRNQLKLSATPSDWTFEQRGQYNKALAAYIAANPDQFSAVDLTTATVVNSTTYSPLQDPGFSFGDFAAEFGSNVAAPFKAVGDGILTAANLTKYLIPLAFVGVVVVGFYMLNAKAGSPVKLPGAS